MIAPSAIKAFLARELDSFDDIKYLSSKTLDKECAGIIATIGSKTKPMNHQKVCLLVGTALLRFLFLLDMGTGKSKIALDLLKYHRKTGVLHKPTLVLVPNKANIQVWIDEAKKHHPKMKVREMTKITDASDAPGVDVFVSLYIRISRFVCDNKKTKGGTKKWSINQETLNDFAECFDAMVLDESTAVKNTQSLIFKAADKISKTIKVCYALTGTPHGRNPQDLWGQFKIVDRGITLGETLGMFREAFFTKYQSKVVYYYGKRIPIYDYRLKKDAVAVLSKTLKHRSIRYETEECITLPAVTKNVIRFTMNEGARDNYGQLIEGLRTARTGEEAAQTFTAMRQAVSGFVYITPPEEERQALDFDNTNERLAALLGVVSNIPFDSKFVIFHEFIHSGDVVHKMMQKEKIECERIFSGTKDIEKVLLRFNKNKKCRGLILNNASGAFGLNLQVANYAVFYESPVSPIVRSQAEKRIHRKGQEKKVFYYDLVAANSIDERIRAMIAEGKNLLEELINGRQVI